MIRRSGWAAVLAATSLGACTVNESEDVAAYRSVLDAGLSAPVTAPVAGGKLDVRAAMRLANARNESLDAEGETYVRALLERRRAAAAFLPRLTFSTALFREEHTTSDHRDSGVDAPLLGSLRTNPFADEAEIRRAGLTAEEQRSRLLALQDEVLLDAARAHFGVVLLERRAAVLRSSLAVQEARAEEARVRRDAGLARSLDAALAESSAAGTRVDLVDAETNARRGRALLTFLVGAEVGGVALDDSLDTPETPPALDASEEEAARRREELRAAAQAVSAALAGTEAAYGEWWPTISADVAAFLRHDSDNHEMSPDWTALLSVSVPLFSAGLIEVDVREALSRLREARDRQSYAGRVVRREVEDAWTGFEAARRKIDGVLVRLDAARRALEEADGLWTAGLSTNLERLTAQDEELSAELDLALAEIARKVSYLELRRATGALHELIGLDRKRAEDGAAAAEEHGARTR